MSNKLSSSISSHFPSDFPLWIFPKTRKGWINSLWVTMPRELIKFQGRWSQEYSLAFSHALMRQLLCVVEVARTRLFINFPPWSFVWKFLVERFQEFSSITFVLGYCWNFYIGKKCYDNKTVVRILQIIFIAHTSFWVNVTLFFVLTMLWKFWKYLLK